MRVALVNPPWSFEHSIYFGCREPHLPLEYGAARTLLQTAGHEAEIFDGHFFGIPIAELANHVHAWKPDAIVITTAPSYLFWRCAPPELRVPQEMVRLLREVGGAMIAVGPHASTTPKTTLQKLGVDLVVLGECEEILPQLAGDWTKADSVCYARDGAIRVKGTPHAANMNDLPALEWDRSTIAR